MCHQHPGEQKASQGCIVYGPDIRNKIIQYLDPKAANTLIVQQNFTLEGPK